MYHVINDHIQIILKALPAYQVTEYDWLIDNRQQVRSNGYQARYHTYWGMGAGHLGPVFRATYFQLLQNQLRAPLGIEQLTHQLYQIPVNATGAHRLQFVFATKIFHMAEPTSPVYDSLVAAFYFFPPPDEELTVQQRIAQFVAFHCFLRQEYGRAIQLLGPSIQEFRRRFSPQNFTDQRVIDLLIWAFVGLLRKGALQNGQIGYC